MTDSLAEWIGAATIATVLLTGPAAAVGQTADTSPAGGPSTAPASSAPWPVTGQPANPASHSMGIQVKSLGAVDGPPAGLLDATNGGLGGDIWEGASRAWVEDMFRRLPLATSVASVHALSRRLVLTTADSPMGDAPQGFMSVRLRALLDGGMVDDAGALAVQAVPKNDPKLARLAADSILYAGRANDACGPVTTMRLDSSEPFWVELRAYCYAVSGDTGALDLTRAVMKAQNIDSRGFDTLLDNFVSRHSNLPQRISDPNALDIFLLRAAGLPVDPALSEKLGASASTIAMRDPKNSPAQRLDAAEEGARSGVASAAELTALADAQTFSPDQLAAADATAPTLPFLAGQALIRQAIKKATDPTVKKKLIFEAMALAYDKNLLPIAATLQGSAASAAVPDRADRGHAALMSSALLLSGHADAAARWYDVLDQNADSDKPLIHLLQVELNLVAPNPARSFEAQGALSWFAAQASAPQPVGGDETLANATLALGIYDALGLTMPADVKAALSLLKARQWPGREPGDEVLRRLHAGIGDSGRRGEAILSLLDFIGAGGPGDMAPDALVACVKALVEMGYGDAAHDLAFDSLLLRRAPAPQTASAP